MRVAIVGAGLSGLAAARELTRSGVETVVFEAGSRAGGRLASERLGSYIFDTGSSTVAPRGLSLERTMLDELDTRELAKVEAPICVHSSLRITGESPMRNRIERYVYLPGNERLAELLSEGLDVRFGRSVSALGKSDGLLICEDETFGAVIVTPPAPIARQLLMSAGEGRPLANVSYRSCLCVLLAFDREIENGHFHGVLDPEQRHPLTWLSIESAKCKGRAPAGHTAFVAQLSSEYSARYFDVEDDKIVSSTLDFLERLYGPGWSTPEVAKVVRWRHSHPENTSSFESANRPGDKVVVAGDGLMGARIEFAYETGIRAARFLLEKP